MLCLTDILAKRVFRLSSLLRFNDDEHRRSNVLNVPFASRLSNVHMLNPFHIIYKTSKFRSPNVTAIKHFVYAAFQRESDFGQLAHEEVRSKAESWSKVYRV